ncbi:MAG: 16S rRNA (guanine(527)-N(7))-methyltransferase RsmG, partial [Treponema sp.]|nr:16S rRNA (guanine(527)-N(7))-methyltransferase RsmG [Treponema sp.]
HILDSLSAAQNIKKIAEKIGPDVKIADIGSGGGLPGIPLAAAFPQFNFFLVERMAKRCAFLENCAAILGLKNVTVWNKEAEKVPAESFDISVFRAFRPLDEQMIKTLLSLTKTGGFLAAYKAKSENIKTEMDAINKIVPEYNVEKLFVPGLEDSERNLVIVKK